MVQCEFANNCEKADIYYGTGAEVYRPHGALRGGAAEVDRGRRSGRRRRRRGGRAVPPGRQLRHGGAADPSVGAVPAAGGRPRHRGAVQAVPAGGQGYQCHHRVGTLRLGCAAAAGAADLRVHGHHPPVRRQRRPCRSAAASATAPAGCCIWARRICRWPRCAA